MVEFMEMRLLGTMQVVIGGSLEIVETLEFCEIEVLRLVVPRLVAEVMLLP